MQGDTISALNDAVVLELNEKSHGEKSVKVEVVPTISYLRNGLKRCVVQVKGKSGRNHRIETIGLEAETLFQEATRLRDVLSTRVVDMNCL